MTPPAAKTGPRELAGIRRTLHLKLRFGLAKLPVFPVRYRLRTPGLSDAFFLWTRVIPFMDPVWGAFNFDLYGWDVRELRFLRRFLRTGMAFVDIGAHHGLYSVLAARQVGPRGRVAAFEPAPGAFRRLRWHLRLNRAPQVAARRRALGSGPGRATLYVPVAGVDTVSSLRRPPSGAGPYRGEPVDLAALDEVMGELGWPSIDLVKVDAEGAETDILDGAAQTIARHRPIWLFEALDSTSGAWGGSGRSLVERFGALDCKVFEFTPEGALHPHHTRQRYILDSNCNLLAVPRERLGAVAPLLGSAGPGSSPPLAADH